MCRPLGVSVKDNMGCDSKIYRADKTGLYIDRQYNLIDQGLISSLDVRDKLRGKGIRGYELVEHISRVLRLQGVRRSEDMFPHWSSQLFHLGALIKYLSEYPPGETFFMADFGDDRYFEIEDQLPTDGYV